MTGTRVTGMPSQPVAFNTLFGWIVLGPADHSPSPAVRTLVVQSNAELESSLTRFCTLEEPSSPSTLSINNTYSAKKKCSYRISRTSSGRFCISLPFKSQNPNFGDTKGQALHRFRHLEWRLSKDHDLRTKYVEFMQDYLGTNHMGVVPVQERSSPNHYYIPLHYILRPDSQTTKLRAVFYVTAKGSAGISLNNCLYTGPKMLAVLSHVLMRLRVPQIMFTADIKQMYIQILIAEPDRDCLRNL